MTAEPISATESTPLVSAHAVPVTVVIIPLIGGEALDNCVRAVAVRAGEVVVVATPPQQQSERHAPRYVGGADEPVPAKRLIGLKAARFPIVAFIEDTCEPCAEWCGAIHAAFADAHVSGACGPIEISPHLPASSRALGVVEYARFRSSVLTRRAGAAPASMAGANFALRSAVLADMSSSSDMVDGALLTKLKTKGKFVVARSAVVTYDKVDVRGARLSTRFHHGRIYGGTISHEKSASVRIALTAKAFAAPVLQFARVCRDAPLSFWRSPPCIAWSLAMVLAWAAGEALGAATGRVGDSLQRWT